MSKEENKTGAYGLHDHDLGLPVNPEFKNIKWPTTVQLASRVKRETIPTSFRIDEVAFATLDLMAKQHGLSLSNLINELFNSYIQQNREEASDSEIFGHALDLYMERFATRLAKLSDMEIVKNYHKDAVNAWYSINGQTFPSNELEQGQVYDRFYEHFVTHHDAQVCGYIQKRCFSIFFEICDDNHPSSVVSTAGWTPEELNAVAFDDYILTIPLSKWVYATTILQEYYAKSTQLFGDKANILSNEFGELQKIVDVINDSAGQTLINNLVQALRCQKPLWRNK